jgi:hypothetical protein
MPRYYFHLYNDLTVIDEEGHDLPDLAVAHHRAIREAREIASQAVRNGHLRLDHRIEIANERGEIETTVHLRDVVKVEG